jgi:tetratricopeptide (TPR) repeat protein
MRLDNRNESGSTTADGGRLGLVRCAAVVGTFAVAAAAAGADDAAQAFLAALRERRLDALLEAFCRRELAAAPQTSPNAELAVELSRLLAARAAETAEPGEREKGWRAADEVLLDAAAASDDPIVQARLTLQRAAVAQAEADWLQQWDEMQGRFDDSPPAARRLRDAVEWLAQLQQSLADASARGGEGRTSVERGRAAQLRRLSAACLARLGAAQTSYALALPPADPKRREMFEAAVETIRRIPPSSDDPESTAASAVWLSRALRGLGRWREAWEALEAVESIDASPAIADRVFAERIEVLLGEDRLLEALELLHNARSARTNPPPQWEYLYLKILLGQAKAMHPDADAVGKLQASALRQLRRLEAAGDPVWLRRGELLLSRHARGLLLRDAEEYRQAGEILARAGDFAKAADLYRRAAEEALGRNQESDAVTLLTESARSWEKAASYASARDGYADLARRWPQHGAAAEALLRASVNARAAYLQDPTPENYAAIHRLVDEHLDRYPDADSAGEIRYLRGALRKAERKYEEAVREYTAIPPDHRLRRAGLVAAARTYEAWKAPLSDDALPDAALGRIVTFLESLLLPAPGEAPPLTPAERAEISVRLAKFLLDARVDRPADAEARLEAVLHDSQSPHEWRQQARRLLILAQARQSKYAAAERLARDHSESPPEELLASIELLQRHADVAPEVERPYIGRLQSNLASPIAETLDSLPAKERLPFELALARIELNLAAPDALMKAERRLALLRSEHPRDPRILELLGECLARQRRFPAAIEIWRRLIAGLPAESPGWYRAKLQLIDNLRRSGKSAEARDVLDLLEAIYPELGGPRFRDRFQAQRNALASRRE